MKDRKQIILIGALLAMTVWLISSCAYRADTPANPQQVTPTPQAAESSSPTSAEPSVPVPPPSFLPTGSKAYINPEDLFEEYGWTINQALGYHQITLPRSFSHLPGDFPIPIYWAYNNALSNAIGLDFSALGGAEVEAIVYSLEEVSPPCLHPYNDARGIAITANGNVIGAWLDAGAYLDKACALDGRTLQEIVGLTWGQWLVETGIVDPENMLEKSIAAMSPEETVHAYY
ncbi:MAG: DUF4830 domain-containing protein, partial [Chloroflexi bacterium]|nr:DUF4830 domain-containing protein [Chloroflexota bacterium]